MSVEPAPRHRTRRIVWITIAAVVAAAAVFVLGVWWGRSQPAATPTASPSPTTSATDTPSPETPSVTPSRTVPTRRPTPAPSRVPTAVPPSAPGGPDRPTPLPTDAAGRAAVSPVITYADVSGGVLEAAGFVPSVIEDGGTCTLVATGPAGSREASVSGTANAQNTSCGRMTIPEDQLTPGSWSVTLRYASPRAEGTSAPVTVTVP